MRPRETQGAAFEHFRVAQIGAVGRLVDLARDLTGDYFQMGFEEARQVPYDIRTLTHLEQTEIHADEVLADIARYQYTEPRFGRKRDLYRVNLQDHNILRSLRRESASVKFKPLLLYILTHEIIHVVRFVKCLAPFHSSFDDRNEEERRVHATTRRILSGVRLEGMLEVLQLYEHMASRSIFL